MNNKFRLSSSTYEREEENDKVNPAKIYFLSVEGNKTEKEYFEGISANRKKLGISSRIDVKVLGRSDIDTQSAPSKVIELLEEYVNLRGKGCAKEIIEIMSTTLKDYDYEFVQQFLQDPESMDEEKRNRLQEDLKKAGYDYEYRSFLEKYDSELDEFGIVIDRDRYSNSETMMEEIINHCQKKRYVCYITNPCFEFWLLLHLSDITIEYQNRMHLIHENRKISNRHTYVSKEVSEKAHHGKKGIEFADHYLDKVHVAVERAKAFSSDEVELINNVGTNLWKLIEKMKED